GSTGFFSLNLSVYETVISSIMVVGQPAVFAVLVFRREPCRMCYCRRLPADRTGGRKSIDIVCRAVPDAPGHALFPDFGFLTSLPSPPDFSRTAIAAFADFSIAFSAAL